jgi:hypothetical protein
MNVLRRFWENRNNTVWLSWAVIIIAGTFSIAATYLYFSPALDSAIANTLYVQNSAVSHAEDLLSLSLFNTFDTLLRLSVPLSNQESQSIRQYHIDALHQAGFTSLLLLNREGDVLYTDQVTSSESYVDDDFFKQALSGKRYISPVYFGEGGPSLRIAISTSTASGVVVLSGELRVSLLWKAVQLVKVPEGKVYIVDQTGTIVADPDPVRASSGENLLYTPIVADLLREGSTISLVSYTTENGQRVVASGIRMPVTGWAVIAEQTQSAAFDERNQTERTILAFGISELLLLCMLAIFLRSLIRDLYLI